MAASLAALILLTITLYFSFYAILYHREENPVRMRALVIAGAAMALVMVAGAQVKNNINRIKQVEIVAQLQPLLPTLSVVFFPRWR